MTELGASLPAEDDGLTDVRVPDKLPSFGLTERENLRMTCTRA